MQVSLNNVNTTADYFHELANTTNNFSSILNDDAENSTRIASEGIESFISLIVIIVNLTIIFDCKCKCISYFKYCNCNCDKCKPNNRYQVDGKKMPD